MLEELCRTAFWEACKEVSEKNYELVRLKSSAERRSVEYKYRYFWEDNVSYARHNWHRLPVSSIHGQRKSETYQTRQRAWTWFNEHENELRDCYIKKRYRGNIETAMEECKQFTALFEGFYDYFTERRNGFMKKTNELMEQKQKELARMGKHPQSHGGVANLLKVLTKTMHEQGNSIYTIAKVQYQICMQAGIYIPDEFLTDILVAGDMLQEGNGRVVGEFVCDKLFPIFSFSGSRFWLNETLVKETMLEENEIIRYAGGAKEIYGWHISNLKMYDKPKELREFRLWNRPECAYGDLGYATPKSCDGCNNPPCHVQRAFQSLGYVEELQ